MMTNGRTHRWLLGRIALLPLVPLLCVLMACSTFELPGALGEQCDLNSDCDAPLVCLLRYCRVECATSRDCRNGLDCVQDNTGHGACQLVDETQCTLASDCPDPLVCTRYADPRLPSRILGECTNVCACAAGEASCMSRDCPPGAACVVGMDGATSCLDTSTRACIYDSDCAEGDGGMAIDNFEVCAGDGRCRTECGGDTDTASCRNGETCEPITLPDTTAMGFLCIFTGAPPILDGGIDAGM